MSEAYAPECHRSQEPQQIRSNDICEVFVFLGSVRLREWRYICLRTSLTSTPQPSSFESIRMLFVAAQTDILIIEGNKS